MAWFDVDKEGLRKLVENRGKEFVIFELVQNAWDEASTEVKVWLHKIEGRPFVSLVVEDDNPDGFKDLSHAFTLFAESGKKDNPEQRGRFNLGEKLVLALCKEAEVISTTGGIRFGEDGKRTRTRRKTPAGSMFEAKLRMNQQEFEQVCEQVKLLIPPEGVKTTFNRELLRSRTPISTFSASLPTLRADEEGVLRETTRKTTVRLYEPLGGETATIYEMGIPVVETGDRYHVDIQQKVPLNMDRDNVRPAYLRKLRTLVLNHTYTMLDEEETTATWVSEALADKNVEVEAVKTVVTSRFGEGAVAYDPSDKESNHRAAGHDRTVVAGRTLSKDQWANIRRAGALPAAGREFPTPGFKQGAGISFDPMEVIPSNQWTYRQLQVVCLAERMADKLMGIELDVEIVRSKDSYLATYSRNHHRGTLRFNLRNLGEKWFDKWQVHLEKVIDLIIHEFGHQYADSHLSDKYHEALSRMAGEATVLAIAKPQFFMPQQNPKSRSA